MNPAFHLQSPEINQDPYPLFARLREKEPVVFARSQMGDAFMLSRYDDVRMCLEDTERFVSDARTVRERADYRPW